VSRHLVVRNEARTGDDPCLECASTTRRAFIGQAAAIALAATVGFELTGEQASAFPITFATGTPQGPSERSYPIPSSDGATIDRENEVIIARFHQAVFAFNLACPHENTALRWRQDDQRFQCPRHGSKYQPDGTFISGRATRNMDRLPITRAGDTVVVDLSRILRSDQQPAEWAADVVTL
jgi:nitrite reductase/ring-hydroxylating ferredoxin subunit